MRKLIAKKVCVDEIDLKAWIHDILTFSASEFGWDGFICSGCVKDNIYTITVVEK